MTGQRPNLSEGCFNRPGGMCAQHRCLHIEAAIDEAIDCHGSELGQVLADAGLHIWLYKLHGGLHFPNKIKVRW